MQYKHVHFIGIGGVGMSAVAKLLKDTGVRISGSDEAIYPPASTFLEQVSIVCKTPYSAANIPPDTDLIVIGKNAKLVPETNEEVRAALLSGVPIRSFPEVLAELSKEKEAVVVAGSFGKSTCTAMLAHCLMQAGLEPSFFIGAVPLSPNIGAQAGAGGLFIIEGDEYPSSNTDPRSKFLHYHPAHLLLTPLAHDHVNVFPTPEAYLEPFLELVALLPSGKKPIVSSTTPMSRELLERIGRSAVTYGITEGTFSASDIHYGEITSFTLMQNGAPVVRIETNQLGQHNVENIVGVSAFILSNKLMQPETLVEGMRSFRGIRRRLDRKSDRTTIPIFEGFGSSYEKARSAIEAMRLHFPDRRLVVIFEPHTFSWRNRDAIAWYDTVFAGAGKVFIYEPATQGSGTHKQLSQSEIVERVHRTGCDAIAIHEHDGLENIAAALHANDAILLLSSGPLGGLIERVTTHVEERFPLNR